MSPAASTQASPLVPLMILYGRFLMSFCVASSSKRRPIKRFVAKTVFSGLVTAWRFAGTPTRRCPSLVKATMEGVVRMPSLFSSTLGELPSMMATQEFVVPRSMPTMLPAALLCLAVLFYCCLSIHFCGTFWHKYQQLRKEEVIPTDWQE